MFRYYSQSVAKSAGKDFRDGEKITSTWASNPVSRLIHCVCTFLLSGAFALLQLFGCNIKKGHQAPNRFFFSKEHLELDRVEELLE